MTIFWFFIIISGAFAAISGKDYYYWDDKADNHHTHIAQREWRALPKPLGPA